MEPYTIDSDAIVGRLRVARGAASTAAAARPRRPAPIAVLLCGSSMRVMETGLALVAIATAVLLGLGR